MAFESTLTRPRIAVIGAGISGMAAAFALKDVADVTLFESRDRLGGHACTLTCGEEDEAFKVDIGFIVCNDLNYPNFIQMLDHLGVGLVDSDMSFSVSNPTGYEWSSDPRGLFAWKRYAADPKFWRLLGEIVKFNTRARTDIAAGVDLSGSLGGYLDALGATASFRENYLLPMGAAIWSTPEQDILDYPAEAFIRFFNNHRLMHADRPVWRTVRGGSRSYVERLAERLGPARIRLSARVERIAPGVDGKLEVDLPTGERFLFDDVILAGHSDQSLKALSPAFRRQREALSKIRYAPNRVYLHQDARLMPRRKAAWASWNVLRGQGEQVCVTYWMNRLQKFKSQAPVFVTLNPAEAPRSDAVLHETSFDHPQFDVAAQCGRAAVAELQGADGIWFAGAWLGDGFHESGLKSGLAAGLALGGRTPWTPVDIPHLVRPSRIMDDIVQREAMA